MLEAKFINFKDILKIENFSCGRGQIVGILGESGSGKSSILKCLCKLEKSNSLITVDKRPVTGKEFNMCFQDFFLLEHLSVHENLKIVDSKYYQFVNNFKISHILNRKIEKLSGGEMQRVSLLRSLLQDKKYILLDEPFNNLDAIIKNEIRDFLLSYAKTNAIGIVIVSHDINDLNIMCDRIYCIKEGKIVQSGTYQDLYEKPVNEYVARLTGDINIFNGKLYRPEQLEIDIDIDSLSKVIYSKKYPYGFLTKVSQDNIILTIVSQQQFPNNCGVKIYEK